nr:suppressor of mec-8 and unc-52 protein homolog 2 [Tanacetum cinerariifolium]
MDLMRYTASALAIQIESAKPHNRSSFMFGFTNDAGDVEHTHLVKGLDYALLNKDRSEIVKKPDTPQDDDHATPRGMSTLKRKEGDDTPGYFQNSF